MATQNTSLQESSYESDVPSLLISGRRNDAVCPPVHLERDIRYEIENDDDVSMDYRSFQSEDARTSVSEANREASIDQLPRWYLPPDPNDASFGTPEHGRVEDNHLFTEHTPEQDSSPHESLEQGNPTCLATSESSQATQQEYKREEEYAFPEMSTYNRRLETFREHKWDPPSPSPEEFSRSGMFYEGVIQGDFEEIHDQVVCFKCGNTLRGWRHGENPHEEHRRVHPNCFRTKWGGDV